MDNLSALILLVGILLIVNVALFISVFLLYNKVVDVLDALKDNDDE